MVYVICLVGDFSIPTEIELPFLGRDSVMVATGPFCDTSKSTGGADMGVV